MAEIVGIATELYGLPLDEFVAARTAASKQAKDDGDVKLGAAVGRLRKPTVGASVVNRLARAEPDLVDDVLELGDRLRQAQDDADGPAMKELEKERRALVSRCLAAARELGSPTAAALSDVEDTVRAALADPAAGDALSAGTLVKPLSPAGFGSVDVSGSVALPELAAPPREARSSGRARTPQKSAATKAREAAQARLDEATDAADEATREVDDVTEELAAAQEAAEEAAAAVARLEKRLASREQAAQKAADRRDSAQKRLDAL